MNRRKFDKNHRYFFPQLHYTFIEIEKNAQKNENKEKTKRKKLTFCNMSIENSFCRESSSDNEEFFKIANKVLNAYAHNLDLEHSQKEKNIKNKEYQIETKENENRENDEHHKLVENLELDIINRKESKNLQIFEESDSFSVQLEKTLSYFNRDLIEFNYMKQNSLFTCFSTLDDLEFESDAFFLKSDAKEELCRHIIEYLFEKYIKN